MGVSLGFTFTTDTYIALAALLQPYIKSLLNKIKVSIFGRFSLHLPLHSAISVEYTSVGLVVSIRGTVISPDQEYYISSVEGLWVSQLDKAQRTLLWMGTGNTLIDNNSEPFEPATVLRIPKGQPVKLKFILQDFRSFSDTRECLEKIKAVFQGRIHELMTLQESKLRELPDNYLKYYQEAADQAWLELKNYQEFHEARRQLSKIFPLVEGKYTLQLRVGTLSGKTARFNYEVTLNQNQVDKLDKFNQNQMINFECARNVPGAMYFKALPTYSLEDSETTIDVRLKNRTSNDN